MPDTSRKLAYTAAISVRWEGLTAIMKGSPPTTSSVIRNPDAHMIATTAIDG